MNNRRTPAEGSVSLGQATVIAKTSKALLLALHDEDDRQEWFPVSQIHDDSEVYDSLEIGEGGELVVTEWIAEQKGLG